MPVLNKIFTFCLDRLNTRVIHLQGAGVYPSTNIMAFFKENYYGHIIS
jgi:hypothetical protein